MGRRKNKKKVNESINDEINAQSLADEFDENTELNKNRWENSPYLEGLNGNIDESKTKLFEPTLEQRVPEDNKEGSLSGLENDDQPQYPLSEEKPDIIYNQSQILIGDNKGIFAQSDNPLIYGEFDENDSDENEEKQTPIDVKSLSKKDYRYFLRTGTLPQ